MRTGLTVIVLLVMVGVPEVGRAAPRPAANDTGESPNDRLARHAVRGVIKAVASSSIVVSRPGRRGGDLTFTITPSTDRDGMLRVGATVSIRYRIDGDSLIATAVIVHAPQRPASPLHAPP
jgi:hypothetical protein